jgi:hypothetical protein
VQLPFGGARMHDSIGKDGKTRKLPNRIATYAASCPTRRGGPTKQTNTRSLRERCRSQRVQR